MAACGALTESAWARLHALLLIAFLATISSAGTQTELLRAQLPVTVVREFDHHSLGPVNAVAFDSTGCLWLATPQGLCRMDGQRIQRFGPRNGLPDLHVYDVVCDPGGVVYAGTWRGVGVLRGERFETVVFPSLEGGMPSSEVVTTSPARLLTVSRDGGLWVSGDGDLLRRIGPGGMEPSAVRTPVWQLDVPTHLAIDRQGRLWLAYLRPQPESLPRLYCLLDDTFANGETMGMPPDIREIGSNDRGLWLQTADGTIWKESDGGLVRAELPPEWPRAAPLFQWLTADSLNVLVSDSAVVRFEDGGRHSAVGHHPLNVQPRVALDLEGNAWCPADLEGVVRVGFEAIQWYRLPEGHHVDGLRSGPDGVVWGGSPYGLHYGQPAGKDLVWSSLRLPPVTALQVLESDSVIVGTVDGAFLVAGSPLRVAQRWTREEGLPSRVVTVLAGEGSRSGWIGTAAGVARWSAGESRVCMLPDMTMSITDLLPDEAGVWIGTWAGMWRWHGGVMERVTPVDNRHLLPAISAFHREPGGRNLVGTYSDGMLAISGDTLSRLPTPLSRVLSIVPRAGGAPFLVGVTRILAMEASDGFKEVASFEEPHPVRGAVGVGDDLWLVTSTSVERWGLSEGPVKLNALSGLPDEPFVTLEAGRRGDLWVATRHHLCHIDPSRLGTRPVRGRLTAAVVHEGRSTPVPPDGRHELPPGIRGAALEFGLPYLPGGEMELRTRLDPLQPAWMPWTSQWERQYAALPPGEHIVWAQARTLDGRSSPETVAAVIVVPARWHERAWVRIVGAFLLLALGGLAGLSRIAAARARASTLERLVSERTAELDAARAKAVEASMAKSLLLSRMSHELRTPLSAMMGFADLIAEAGEASVEHRNYARVITDAGEKLLALIRSILDLSKAEAAVGECKRVPFELRPLILDVVQLLSVRAADGRIALTADDDGWPSCPVNGDPDRLREVLINLLGNALKYTGQGGNVRVSCRADEHLVALSVHDNGPGISPEDQKRLFDPFVRLSTRETGEEGAGLGLTITKQLVEAMGGAISVESAVGVGATFTVTLPQP
jgi:signal transduction histidine kinase